jgi:hypothetical protein
VPVGERISTLNLHWLQWRVDMLVIPLRPRGRRGVGIGEILFRELILHQNSLGYDPPLRLVVVGLADVDFDLGIR